MMFTTFCMSAERHSPVSLNSATSVLQRQSLYIWAAAAVSLNNMTSKLTCNDNKYYILYRILGRPVFLWRCFIRNSACSGASKHGLCQSMPRNLRLPDGQVFDWNVWFWECLNKSSMWSQMDSIMFSKEKNNTVSLKWMSAAQASKQSRNIQQNNDFRDQRRK